MNSSYVLNKNTHSRPAVRVQPRVASGSSRHGFLLGLLIFMLLAAPKTRIAMGGAPLYLVDGLIILLLAAANKRPSINWRPLQPIPQLAKVYLIFVCIGELRGLMEYMALPQSTYMLGRFCLGISLCFTLPRLITSFDELGTILKGAMAGLLFSAFITICYSLAPTRSLVVNLFLSRDFLCPGAERLAMETLRVAGKTGEAMRGYSLIGAATMTTGFLGTAWPLTFFASRWSGLSPHWRQFALIVSIITPIGILMTYGRVAWLTVIVIGALITIFGFAGGRRNILLLALGCALAVNHFGLQSNMFMFDRIVKRTDMAINAPTEGVSERERFMSYIEPFEHLMENPIWLVAGTGRTGERMSRRGDLISKLYDEAGLATHSAFARAYYSFGLPAAIAQVLLMLSAFRFILRRINSSAKRKKREQLLCWQSFLMAWCGLTLWWLAGHAPVGEPRGVMLVFFMYGLLLACARLYLLQENKSLPRKRNTNQPVSATTQR